MGKHSSGSGRAIHLNPGCQGDLAGWPIAATGICHRRSTLTHRTVAYRPGKVSEVVTEHYRRAHPEALGLPSR